MSISASAVLVELNISVWPASKVDKEVTDTSRSGKRCVANQEESICRYDVTQRHREVCGPREAFPQSAYAPVGRQG